MNLLEKPDRMFNREFLLIIFLTLLYGFNMNLINPIIAEYTATTGANETMGGLAVGLLSITALLLRPITGPLANNCNKKHMLVLSFAAFVAASFGYIFSDNIYAILVFRFIHGFGLSLCSSLLPTLVCEYVPENRIGSAIGYFTLMQTFAVALAPGIAIGITGRYGYPTDFAAAGIIALVAVLVVFITKKQRSNGGRFRFTLTDMIAKKAVFPSVLHMLGAMGYSLIASFTLIYATTVRGIPGEAIGWSFAVYALILAVIRPILTILESHVKELHLIVICSLFSAASMIILSFADTVFLFILSSVLNALGFGVLMPLLQALAIKLVPADSRAVANSTFNSGMDIGMGIGPVLGGAVASAAGYDRMFLVFAVFAVIVIILSLTMKNRLKPEEIN